MLRAFKYRLYPTPEQAEMIDQTIGVCRLVYNLALEVKIGAYREHGIRLSAYDIQKQLKDLRDGYPWIGDVNSCAIYDSILQIDYAFKNFYSGNGYPKFKKKRNGGSFRCVNNIRRINWEDSTLTVSKIKNIAIRLSRKFDGEIRTVTISKSTTGKYFASVLIKTIQAEPSAQAPINAVGVDLGLKDFAVLSTGEKIPNPKHLQAGLKRLKTLQHRASRKKKGSKNRAKANLRVALLHEKISNRRQDFLHKLSTKLICDSQADTICVESLNVSGMIKNRKISQAVGDVSWFEFVRQLEYKGKWYGKNLIKIGRFFSSSKICSNCGHKYDELNLSEREWRCNQCGTIHDRDINAAINIRNSAMGSRVGLVESPALVGAMKQESMPNPSLKKSGSKSNNIFKGVNSSYKI